MAGVTEVYTSAPYVLIETRSNGVLDVSDDVQNVSVSRRLDAVSTAEVTLNNYATYNTGRYNGIINIGDRAHVSFYVDGQRIQQITGRVSRVPIQAFQEGAYKITISDAIGDLQYIYWDPYSQEAQTDFTGPQVFQVQDDIFKYSASGSDNGIGVLINSFLQKVCGFPDGSVKVAKFPDINNVVKNVVDAIIKGDVSDSELESQYQMYFDMIFGAGTDYSDDVSGDSSSSSDEDPSKTGEDEHGQAKNNPDGACALLLDMFDAPENATVNDWNTYVQFKPNYSSDPVGWGVFDKTEHTGLYGLTTKQVKEAIGKNVAANTLSRSEQTKAAKVILKKCQNAIPKSNSTQTIPVRTTIYYYLTGKVYSPGRGGSLIRSSVESILVVKGKEIKNAKDWESVTAQTMSSVRKFKGTSSDRSSRSVQQRALVQNADGTKTTTTKQASRSGLDAASQAKWDSFVAKYGEGKPQSYFDGSQCWALYSVYNNIMFGASSASGVNSQNGGGSIPSIGIYKGNGPYWQVGLDHIQQARDLYLKIGSGDKAQRGDAAFWWDSGTGNPYGHVAIVLDDDGNTFHVLEQWDGSGTVRRGTYTRSRGKFAGFWRPKIFKNAAPDGSATGTSSGVDSSSSGSSSSSDPIRSTAFALFKYVSFWDQNKTIESQMLGGELALKNDQPAFDYLKTLCNASFRSFMSMPDGSIAAFVPDYFGFINQDGGTPNQIDIPMVEVINFNSYFDKSSYVSHYYLLTNEISGNPMNAGPGSSINDSSMFSRFGNVIRSQNSSGTMTLENAKKADAIFKLMNAENISGCSNAQEMLQKWGVSVKNEENDLIVDHTLTALYALFQFLKFWANCFTSSLSITFKPEIIPGLRVRIPDAGTTLFVKSVTHSWDASSGGRTTISTVCPVTDSGLIGIEKK